MLLLLLLVLEDYNAVVLCVATGLAFRGRALHSRERRPMSHVLFNLHFDSLIVLDLVGLLHLRLLLSFMMMA